MSTNYISAGALNSHLKYINVHLHQNLPWSFVLTAVALTDIIMGTRKRCWLRHYATARKVVGSLPDEVTGFFKLA
jgi:hypothetical protein